MESIHYWQFFGKLKDMKILDGQRQKIPSPEQQSGEIIGSKMIVYGGQEIPIDVYLAVPTFIRRGISLAI